MEYQFLEHISPTWEPHSFVPSLPEASRRVRGDFQFTVGLETPLLEILQLVAVRRLLYPASEIKVTRNNDLVLEYRNGSLARLVYTVPPSDDPGLHNLQRLLCLILTDTSLGYVEIAGIQYTLPQFLSLRTLQ